MKTDRDQIEEAIEKLKQLAPTQRQMETVVVTVWGPELLWLEEEFPNLPTTTKSKVRYPFPWSSFILLNATDFSINEEGGEK